MKPEDVLIPCFFSPCFVHFVSFYKEAAEEELYTKKWIIVLWLSWTGNQKAFNNAHEQIQAYI